MCKIEACIGSTSIRTLAVGSDGQSVQLDPLSYELNNYLEDEIEAMLMSQVQSEKQIWFAYADIFKARKEFVYAFNAWFAEMMWGTDKRTRDGYLPLGINFNGGDKNLGKLDPKWKWEFTKPTHSESGRRSWQEIADCAYNTTQYPRPSIFEGGKDNASSCFDTHATQEVRNAILWAGDYHKFVLDRTFTHQEIEVCFLIF